MNQIVFSARLRNISFVFVLVCFFVVSYLYFAPKWDTYGGNSPEESWSGFVEALSRNDLDSAARHFELSKQKEAMSWLLDVKNNNQLEVMLKDLSISNLSVKRYGEDVMTYGLNKEGQDFYAGVVFIKNKITGTWKIFYFEMFK